MEYQVTLQKTNNLNRHSLRHVPVVGRRVGASVLLLGTLFSYGCSQSPNEEYMTTEEAVESESAIESVQEGEQSLMVKQLTDDSEATLGSEAADISIAGKELMVSASASFEVKDVVNTRNEIESLTRQQGGYIAESSISNNQIDSRTYRQGDKDITVVTYTRHADMIIRVPREKVSSFLRQVQKQVKFLSHEQFSAKDVTLDLYREKLQAQLNQDMASDIEQERLNSENEKQQKSNIDAINATYSARQREQYAELERLNIEDKVKYSTLELSFSQPNSVYKKITPNIESLIQADEPSFSEQVKQSLIEGWEIIKNVVLGVIMLWWFWLLLIVGYLLYRAFRKAMIKFYKGDNTHG